MQKSNDLLNENMQMTDNNPHKRAMMPRARHLALEFIVQNIENTKSKTKQKQLLLSKGDWYDVFTLPIAESVVGSREDPLADVEVAVVVFYSMNPIFADAERKLAGMFAAYHLLSFDGEA